MKVGDVVRFRPNVRKTFGVDTGTVIRINRIGNLEIMCDDGHVVAGVFLGNVEVISGV
jgi:hypothetical protein